MSINDQIIACAELDGWNLSAIERTQLLWQLRSPDGHVKCSWETDINKSQRLSDCLNFLPNYDSRDVLVPLIEKHTKTYGEQLNFIHELNSRIISDLHEIKWPFCLSLACLLSTPAQLREALLRATGKWKQYDL